MDAKDRQVLRMVQKSIIFYMVEREMLSEKGLKYISSIEDAIMRAMQEYKDIDLEEYPFGNDVESRIKRKEKEIHINMAVRRPDEYYIGNGREIFDNQNFLRDEEWLKEIEQREDVLED